MTAYVFFMIFCSLIGVAVRSNRSIWHFCHSAGNQKQKAGKRVRKEIKWRRGHRWIRELVKE